MSVLVTSRKFPGQKVKVLHVIPSISPELGGPTQVVLNLVKALRDQGIDAEIVTTNDNGADLLNVPLNQRIDYPIADNQNETVPVWFLPRFSPPLKEFIFSSALTKWLWQHIDNYDIVELHYLFSYASTCGGIIARWKHVPYLVRTMGQLTPWALAQSRLKKQLYMTLFERRNLSRAGAIHCTALEEVEDVRRNHFQTPTITLPLGVNPPCPIPDARLKLSQQYGISCTAPIVLFLSRLHYKKRPDLLLHALKQLANQGEQFHLMLAGSGEAQYINDLKHLAHSLQLADRVTFTGFVGGAAKDLLLQASDLFVLPSFSENFGIAIAEAMAAGLPVIITSGIQIAAEIGEANAGLVVEGEGSVLATAISKLLNDPALRQSLGKNGINLVKRLYSWDVIAANLTLVYAAIVDQQPLNQFDSYSFS